MKRNWPTRWQFSKCTRVARCSRNSVKNYSKNATNIGEPVGKCARFFRLPETLAQIQFIKVEAKVPEVGNRLSQGTTIGKPSNEFILTFLYSTASHHWFFFFFFAQ